AGGARDRLTQYVYLREGSDDVVGRMELAFNTLLRAEPVYDIFQKAVAGGQAEGFTFDERLASCEARELLTADEAALVREYEAVRREAIETDAFPAQELTPQASTAEPGPVRQHVA
ncbi:MAG: acyl-CoA dehydrogenase domain-containing protein, partial [Aquisalimonadaceae bacterium]